MTRNCDSCGIDLENKGCDILSSGITLCIVCVSDKKTLNIWKRINLLQRQVIELYQQTEHIRREY